MTNDLKQGTKITYKGDFQCETGFVYEDIGLRSRKPF